MADDAATVAPLGRRGTAASTRERILDIALELFAEQGYEATSLRDIAERLGTTKAALYYHFERKEEILLELHLRLHDLGADLLDELEALPDDAARVAAWPDLIARFIDRVADNRQLVRLHQRNATALRAIADNERHRAANADAEERFRRLLTSPSVPLEARVRVACSIGAVMGGMIGAADLFGEVEPDEVTPVVTRVVADLFRPAGEG